MRRGIRLPDWAIVGGPKCGTTSLFAYLGDHPGVYAPKHMKEPRYYCFDEPGYRLARTPEEYSRLFEPAAPGQLAGEASAAYLFSPVALRHLLTDNPACKLIAMVRNPIELVVSLHAQKLWAPHGEEHIEDFEQAWRLSPERRAGRMVVKSCRAPRYLDYQSVGRLGEQIARLQAMVPEEQVHVIVHDDIRSDVRGVYRGVLDFLGLPDDGRLDFSAHNTRKRQKYPALMRLLTAVPLRGLKRRVKALAPGASHAVGLRLYAAASAPAAQEDLRPAFRAELIEFYRDDVALLGRQLGRDLRHWLA